MVVTLLSMIPLIIFAVLIVAVFSGSTTSQSQCESYRGRSICAWKIDAGRSWAFALDGSGSATGGPYETMEDAIRGGRAEIDKTA